MLLFTKHFSATVMPDGTVVTMPKLSKFEEYLKKNYGSGYHFTLEVTDEGQHFICRSGHEVLETHELRREFAHAIMNLEMALNFSGVGHYESILYNFVVQASDELAVLLCSKWNYDSIAFDENENVTLNGEEKSIVTISHDQATFVLPRISAAPFVTDVMCYAGDLVHTLFAIEINERLPILEKNLYDFLEMPAFEVNFKAIKKHCENLCFLLNQTSEWDEPQKILEVAEYVKNLQSLMPAAREHAKQELEIARARGKFYEDLRAWHNRSLDGFNWYSDFTNSITESIVNHLTGLQYI